MNTVLHVPLNKTLRHQAEINAKKNGYSSIQELLRVFLVQFNAGAILPGFTTTPHQVLSAQEDNHLNVQLEQLESAVINRDAYTVTTTQEMMNILEK